MATADPPPTAAGAPAPAHPALPAPQPARLTDAQRAELEAAATEPAAATRRLCVPALEAILGQPLPVLDHGLVRVVDYMGDDQAVVQAARVSYGRGTRATSTDRGLIRYLMRHRHSTPFEMCEIKLHVKLPIFVARQWIRHRTANVNEISARYSILSREFYLPAPEHMAAQSSSNRQGRGDTLAPELAAGVLEAMHHDALAAFARYDQFLGLTATEGEADSTSTGPRLARELARIGLPLSTYTEWYWKTDLHNLLHFLSLRADPHAQYEIRAYAEVLAAVLALWVPLTAEAFRDYRLAAATLSAQMLAAVRDALAGGRPDPTALGLSAREWRELTDLFPALSGLAVADDGACDP